MIFFTFIRRSLQIFSEDYHPNVIKGVGRSKEGFSLFGLFDRTKSLPGRQKLRCLLEFLLISSKSLVTSIPVHLTLHYLIIYIEYASHYIKYRNYEYLFNCLLLMYRNWMMNPFCDREQIHHRQDGIAMAVRLNNRDFVLEVSKLLKKIHDMPRILLRIKKVESVSLDWSRLNTTLNSALDILGCMVSFVQEGDDNYDQLDNQHTRLIQQQGNSMISESSRTSIDKQFIDEMLIQINQQVCRQIFNRINGAIDFERSTEIGDTTIRDGYVLYIDI